MLLHYFLRVRCFPSVSSHPCQRIRYTGRAGDQSGFFFPPSSCSALFSYLAILPNLSRLHILLTQFPHITVCHLLLTWCRKSRHKIEKRIGSRSRAGLCGSSGRRKHGFGWSSHTLVRRRCSFLGLYSTDICHIEARSCLPRTQGLLTFCYSLTNTGYWPFVFCRVITIHTILGGIEVVSLSPHWHRVIK